jgi:protein gp37
VSENSKIEWTDHTFNPWEGCQKVSPGCDHCYAETRNARYAGGTAVNWGPGAPRRRTSAANWRKPLGWNAAHEHFFAQHGRRQRVFCASLADVFDNAVDPAWRADLFRLIEATPNLDWLLLTKRIGNAHQMIGEALITITGDTSLLPSWPWSNVWLGASFVKQVEADRDVPKLLATPAAVRFLSMEPLLGPVDLTTVACKPCPTSAGNLWMDPTTGAYECCSRCDYTGIGDEWGIDWVIVGGESGSGARPMHPDWARSLRDQCAAAGVPFLFKQWGEWLPGAHYTPKLAAKDQDPHQSRYLCALWDGEAWEKGNFSSDEIHFEDEPMYQVGKKAAGRQLDGLQHDGYPGAKSGTF